QVEQEVQAVLDRGAGGRAPVGGGPVAEHARRPDPPGARDQQRRLVHRGGVRRQVRVRGRRAVHAQGQLVGAGDAVRVAEARLVVLVRDLQAFELGGVGVLAEAVVPEPQVHGGRGRGPEPDRGGGQVLGGVADV